MEYSISKEQMEFLKSVKPFVALPCYGGQITESFFVSILRTIAVFNRLGIDMVIDTIVNESLIPRGRNSLVAKMMASDANPTHIIFIDVDIGFDETSIIKLLLADKGVVGGLYPKKTLPINYVVNGIPGAISDGSLLKVRDIGTGFLCIKRSVIEDMFEKYSNLKYKTNIGLDPKCDDFTYALFDGYLDPETKDYLSEDYTFCKRWRDIGGEIWTDTSIVLDHSGHYKFQGRGLTEDELLASVKSSNPPENETEENSPINS
jgi:hypothetical protein